MNNQKIYICIDLKSFYSSVECRERGLDPLKTNLVVADSSRTEKTVCLAVTPSLKKFGIPGRARLYQVVQRVNEINCERRFKIIGHKFTGKSYDENELSSHPTYELDYIIAPPRMGFYMKYSTDIYNIYLKYFSAEDIYVYSIDEVFIDVTPYLNTYKMRVKELATMVIHDVFNTTGITATCGIGTNMYLAKIAMDIVAKKADPDKNGVRIAELDEKTYKKLLWEHTPITDFWRVGKGIAKRLEKKQIFTMGDVARASVQNEDKLFKILGINAELLIDHAWGIEPSTIEEIRSYKPKTNSISSGQVLHCPYNCKKTRLIVSEMTELLSLDLVRKHLVTDQLVLTIGYDVENLTNKSIRNIYNGEIVEDRYGRSIPKHSHGTINIDHQTASTKILMQKVLELYDRIINPNLLVRRINVTANKVINENQIKEEKFEQIDLFTDYTKLEKERKQKKEKELKEHNLSIAILGIKDRYGKNAILKGMNFEEGGTTRDRNNQIGGHKG